MRRRFFLNPCLKETLEKTVDDRLMTRKILLKYCSLLRMGFYFLVVVFSLTGCATKSIDRPAPQVTLAERRMIYIDQLREDGVQVIQLGETIRLVLSSDALFNHDSANIRREFNPVLTVLADLINTYDKVEVKVAAYTDNRDEIARQRALTARQSQVVANFLWSHDIDARLTDAVGYNRQNAVDWNGSAMGRHHNRRVEISFRFYPETVPYA